MNTNKPSSTAIFVANGVWWVANHKHLSIEVPEQMGKYNFEMLKHINRGFFSVQNNFGRWLLKMKTSIMLKASMPGFYLHFVLRKRCIEESVKNAIDSGAKQLIIIGAGFDTLSLEIAKDYPDLTIIEIDHPATQEWKRKAVESLDQRFDNLHMLPLDLSHNSMQELLSCSACYDQQKVSVFIAEGLFMYLEEEEVRGILNFVREKSAPDSNLIFTYMEENNKGSYLFSNSSVFTTLWLKMKKEIFTWGLNKDQLIPFLNQSGFRLINCKTHTDLRKEFLSDSNSRAPLVIGENVVVAQLG